MAGLPPSERARKAEESNHPRYERDKQKFAKKEADLERKAREFDDDDPAKAATSKDADADES